MSVQIKCQCCYLNATFVFFIKTTFYVEVCFLKSLRENVFFFLVACIIRTIVLVTNRNESKLVLISAYFSLFWRFSDNFGLFRVNGSYFYSGFYFYPKLIRNKNHRFFLESVGFLFFGILRLFSLRTMVFIKKSVLHTGKVM